MCKNTLHRLFCVALSLAITIIGFHQADAHMGLVDNWLIPLIKPIKALNKPHTLVVRNNKRAKELAVNKVRSKAAFNDPIRFTMQSDKQIIRGNDPIEITITADLLNLPSSLMFFTEDTYSYRIKVIFPKGFIQTGGTYQEYVGDRLTSKGKTSVSYTIRGYFESTSSPMCFQLLRGSDQADAKSTFIDKGSLCLESSTSTDSYARRAASTLTKVRYYYRTDCCLERGAYSTIEASNDNINWVSLATLPTPTSGWNEANLSSTITWRYVRYVPSSSSYGDIAELEFYNGVNKLTGTPFGTLGSDEGLVYTRVFDGDVSTRWNTAQPGPQNYAGLDLGTGCSTPTLTLSSPVCTGSTYSVGFSVQSGAQVTASAGTVSAGTVTNIPLGTNLTVTATLSGCTNTQTASAPTCGGGNISRVKYHFRTDNCSVCRERCAQARIQVSNDNSSWNTIATLPQPADGWNESAVSTSQNWRYVRYVAGDGCYGELLELEFYNGLTKLTGTIFGSTHAANNDFAAYGYPNAFDNNVNSIWHGLTTGPLVNYAGLDLGTGCSTPSLTLNSPVCNGSTYSVGFSVQSGAQVTASAGTVSAGTVTNIPLGTGLTVTATLDGCANTQTASAPTCGSTSCSNTGSITYERWNNISGGDIPSLLAGTSNFQLPATVSNTIASFEAPTDILDSYGTRIRGYVCPPTTGTYVFWVAGDDHVELWLNSSGDTPSNKQRIAYHTNWTGSRDWNVYASQKSAPIYLVAGQKYYIEGLHKEGGGGDNFAVGWSKPGQSQTIPSEVIPGSVLSPYAACVAPSLTLNSPVCNGSTYSVSFSAQSGAQVTASAGTVSAGQVTNIPLGTNLTVTATLSGCANTQTASAPTCGSSTFKNLGRVGTRREYLNIVKGATSNGMVPVTDNSGYSASYPYYTHFFVNDVYVGQTLNNYMLPVNGKYVVDKYITKSQATAGYQRIDLDLYNAIDNPTWVQGYYQQVIDTYDAGVGFPGETSIDGGKGILLPINASWFVKTNSWNYQAVKDAPAPAVSPTSLGKVFGGIQPDGKSTLSEYRAKGWMGFDDTPHRGQEPVSDNERVITAPNYPGSGGPFPSYEQGRAGADNLGSKTFKIQLDQMGENQNSSLRIDAESPGYIGMYERLKEISPSSYLYGNYGQSGLRYRAPVTTFQPAGGGNRNPLNTDTYLNRYQSQQAARTRPNASCPNPNGGCIDDFYRDRFSGKSFSSIGLEQLIQYYPSNVNEIDAAFVKMHEMDIMLKQDPSRLPTLFFWSYRESNVSGNISGIYDWDHETTSPVGRAIRPAKSTCAIVAPEVLAFDATVRGKGVLFWNDGLYQVDDENRIQAPFTFIPNTPGQTFAGVPQDPARNNKPVTPLIAYDAAHQGRDKALRALQWLGTGTPAWQYLTYTLGGVTRTAPADGSAILQHANDYKPMVMLLRNPSTGKRVVWAVDPYCQPNATQTITALLDNGTSISIDLKGNALHVILVN